MSKCYNALGGQRRTQGLIVTSHLFETGCFVCCCIHLQEFSCLFLPSGNRSTLMPAASCCVQFSWTLGIRAQVLMVMQQIFSHRDTSLGPRSWHSSSYICCGSHISSPVHSPQPPSFQSIFYIQVIPFSFFLPHMREVTLAVFQFCLDYRTKQDILLFYPSSCRQHSVLLVDKSHFDV